MKRYIKNSQSDKQEMKRRTKAVNKSIAYDMLDNLSPAKKAVLARALDRNEALTSTYAFPFGTLKVYKEGWLLECEGTRSGFSVWCFDNDGELIEGRKPADSKLNFLYKDSINFNDVGEDYWYSLTK